MNHKKVLQYNSVQGVTLLEILLVLAILTVLISIMIFALRPDDQLTDAYRVEREGKANSIEKALENYAAQNHGKYPFDKDSLEAGTEYYICKYGATCTGNFIDLDTLVDEDYLMEIPVDTENDTETNSGYVITKDQLNNVEIVAQIDAPPILPTDTPTPTPTPTPLACSEGYVLVPGNALYSTSDFCVMKYEAKCADTSNPTVGLTTPTTGANTYANNTTNCTVANSKQVVSLASGYPIASINQTNAAAYCTALGTGYHLISNEEWMTIARNVEQVASNWTTGTVGSGALYSGHNDGVPLYALEANIDDNQGYFGTGQTTPANQRRTHTLSNGQVIWDLAGNIWEWNSNVISCAAAACSNEEMPYDITPASEIVQFPNIATYGQLSYDLIRPSNPAWNTTQGVGIIYTDADSALSTGNVHAFARSGKWDNTTSAGAFMLDLSLAPSFTNSVGGFRCATN